MNDEQLQILYKWYDTNEHVGLQSGRCLDDHEVDLALRVGVLHAERVRVLEVEEMPLAPPELQTLAEELFDTKNALGLTLGYTGFTIDFEDRTATVRIYQWTEKGDANE